MLDRGGEFNLQADFRDSRNSFTLLWMSPFKSSIKTASLFRSVSRAIRFTSSITRCDLLESWLLTAGNRMTENVHRNIVRFLARDQTETLSAGNVFVDRRHPSLMPIPENRTKQLRTQAAKQTVSLSHFVTRWASSSALRFVGPTLCRVQTSRDREWLASFAGPDKAVLLQRSYSTGLTLASAGRNTRYLSTDAEPG
jgi:hypothetical protein